MFKNQYKGNIEIEHGLYLKPEYLIHEHISGNKYRKLKYNLQAAKKEGLDTLLTFGGAFSNHITAVAAAGRAFGFKTIGVVRGEELQEKIADNPTLTFAHNQGMRLHFISRELYREKSSVEFVALLKAWFGEFYLLPEGGTNALAVKGCEEILTEADASFDYICCPVGTGGTISGLIHASKEHQKVLGFPALKGGFLAQEIRQWTTKDNWELITDYHFGGYAKINESLITFINWFKATYNIPLDPVYTGKMLYGIFELLKTGYFKPNDRILAIHTGGLQGIKGMNLELNRKKLPLILE